jgi:hypothetical protein
VLTRLAHAHVSFLPDRMVLAAVGWNTVSFSRVTGCCVGGWMAARRAEPLTSKI